MKPSIAICDPESFYPLRSLVEGRLQSVDDLAAVERFARTVVLHEYLDMQLTPSPYDPETDFEFTEEEKRAGGRMVITAMGPSRAGYDFFMEREDTIRLPSVDPSPTLMAIAKEHSNASKGNPFYEHHVEYLKTVVAVSHAGGSILLINDYGRAIISKAQEYPTAIFRTLDKDWQEFARSAKGDGLGIVVPPILGILLNRSSKRESIPQVLKDLRSEWAEARQKLWRLIHQLRDCGTVKCANEVRKELTDASRFFSPVASDYDHRPLRVFWDLVRGGATGAAVATISGGDLRMGAAAGVVTQAGITGQTVLQDFGKALFGRGAFDLAKKVRKELFQIELAKLSNFLTPLEREKLGL